MTLLGYPIDLWALFVAIIAIIIPLVLYVIKRQKRSLAYNIRSTIPLLSIGKELVQDLEIFYKKSKVEQVHLIELDIINTGNMAIKADDFYRPLSLSLGDEANIFAFEVTKENPSTLNPKFQLDNNKVVLEPLLLNGGDSFSLKFLVEKFKEVIVDGRIVDIKEITAISPLKAMYDKRLYFSIGIGYFLMFVFFSSAYFPNIISFEYIGIPAIFACVFFIPVMLYYFYKGFRTRTK